MTDDEAQSWAEQWIEEWNRRDVEAVLTHFADDVEFRSPVAATVTGDPSGRSRRAGVSTAPDAGRRPRPTLDSLRSQLRSAQLTVQ